MIIGSGTPTPSNPLLCNSELGTFYLDKVNQRLYIRSMLSPNCLQTDWVDISFLISNQLLLKEFNESLQSFFDKIPYNFNTSSDKLTITSQDGSYSNVVTLPTATILVEQLPVTVTPNSFGITSGTIGDVINQTIAKLPIPKVENIQSLDTSKVICHRKNLSSVKVEKDVWTDILSFDTVEIDTTEKMVLDNIILIPKAGYYLIEGRAEFPNIAVNNTIGVALLVNDREVDQILHRTTGEGSQFVKTHYTMNLNKYDTVRMKIFSSLAIEVKKIEMYVELKV